MEVGCVLEVDVNGEEIFVVDKRVLASFSGRLRKLFSKVTSSTSRLKVIFNNFPGGAEAFELMARFYYNNGTTEITSSNVIALNCAAHFMEMDSNSSAAVNFADQTEKLLEGINYWTWSELLNVLRQCQSLFPVTSSSFFLQKVLDCIIRRLALPTVASPFAFSSDNSSYQFSSDTSSICSLRSNCSTKTWWFEDLLFLNAELLEKVIRLMVLQKLEHATIFKFLVFYVKPKFQSCTLAEKCKITEVAVTLLSLLDRNSFSIKGLFHLLRVVSSLKRVSKSYKHKLESLIGSQLDQATVDHLLLPSPDRKNCMYDVDLVLRLVKAFLLQSCISPERLTKVASLFDSYLVEVAPDVGLKPSKFAALAFALPDSARESRNRLYQAIDIYVEVHTQSHEVKILLEALDHRAWNLEFSSITLDRSFIAKRSKLNRVIQNQLQHIRTSSFPRNVGENMSGQEDTSEAGNVEAQLQGIQCQVKRLENIFATMQSHMSNVTKSRLCDPSKGRTLPKLCS